MSYAFVTETLSCCVLINFHTTPTNWLTDWLTGGWLADWLTDYSAYQLTDQLTGLLFQLLTGWLTDWLTVADRLVDLLATILVTNHWNKTRFSWIFGKFCTVSLHTFVLTLMCPSPILEHWDDCNIQINIREGENHTSVSRFVTSIVVHWLIDLTGWQTYWDSYLEKALI